MAFNDILITEIFHSLQGETSLSGVRFAFIRLTGCNLRCSYCDSTYAFKGGKKMSIEQILEQISGYNVKHVLLTGGEPLLQRQTPALVTALRDKSYAVSIETHGEVSIAQVAKNARIVMDIKTPSSGMNRGGYQKNLPHLKTGDEVKFVIASPEDYAWAKEIVIRGEIPCEEILLSPAVPAKGSPGRFPGVDATWLAERILEDRLPVRLQLQLHKLLWGADRHGV
ncbi:MAG: radical SAM protein [Oligoflexia bacterium]|nr:radical SAM protein [Oligoflexia bacterium]